MCGISHNIKAERKRYGSFSSGQRRAKLTEQLPPDQEVKRLRMEVEYLRQEQDFIKKLILAGKEGVGRHIKIGANSKLKFPATTQLNR